MTSEEAKDAICKKGKKLTQRSFVRAVESGSIVLAELYLIAGFDIDATDQHGTGPLMAAVANDHREMVRLLIANGACVDDPELFFLAAYNAAFSDDTAIIDTLADAGAPLGAVDDETGFNAYELVSDMGNEALASHLKKKYGF